MNKKILVVLAALVIVVGGAVAITLQKNNSSQPTAVSSSSQSRSPVVSDTSDGELVTRTGTIECLTNKDTSGPQIEICAIGLKEADGSSYALTSPDPATTGSLPGGQKVRVKGRLTQQTSSQYAIVGSIAVESIEKL